MLLLMLNPSVGFVFAVTVLRGRTALPVAGDTGTDTDAVRRSGDGRAEGDGAEDCGFSRSVTSASDRGGIVTDSGSPLERRTVLELLLLGADRLLLPGADRVPAVRLLVLTVTPAIAPGVNAGAVNDSCWLNLCSSSSPSRLRSRSRRSRLARILDGFLRSALALSNTMPPLLPEAEPASVAEPMDGARLRRCILQNQSQ